MFAFFNLMKTMCKYELILWCVSENISSSCIDLVAASNNEKISSNQCFISFILFVLMCIVV